MPGNSADALWLAGYFDGRGSLQYRERIAPHANEVRLAFSGSTEEIALLQSLIGPGNVREDGRSIRLDYYEAEVIQAFIQTVLPHSRLRVRELRGILDKL